MTTTRRAALVAAIYLGTFMATLDVSIVNVALPRMQLALHTDIAGLQWVVDAYALCLSAFMLSAGSIGDRYGRKRSWLTGIAVFTIGSVLCAVAKALPLLLLGRAIQGIAGALLIPGALSILVHAYPDPRDRAHVIGGWTSFSAISLVIGPVLGGVLVELADWPSIFLVNVPIGLLTLGLGYCGIAETSHPDHAALDPAGQGLSILWLGALAFGLITAGDAGWTAPQTVSALIVAAATLCMFLVVERRAARPLLPVDMFRTPAFAVMNTASFVIGFSTYSSVFFFSLFFQRVQGWSPAAAGWRMAPEFVTMALASPLFGRLGRRYGASRVARNGCGMIGIAMLAMCAVSARTPYWTSGVLLTVLGFGMGLAIPATSAAVMASASPERSGTASATTNMLRQSGMTIGIALLGTLMSARALVSLTSQLAGLNVPDAADVARAAIFRHQFADGQLSSSDLAVLAGRALGDGFQMVMLVAGTLAVAVAVTIGLVLRGEHHENKFKPAVARNISR